MRRIASLVLAGFALAACTKPVPPVGRWAGNYDSRGTMIDARLEIGGDGLVRVSAPDLENVNTNSDDDRAAVHARLASELADGWDQVAPRAMDFDGHVFRKQGGVAPQIVWDKGNQSMTLVIYIGTNPEVRVPLHPVSDFASDPWAG
jgi:hypothetical protein